MSSLEPLSRPSAKAEGHPLPQSAFAKASAENGERACRGEVVATARSWIGTPYRHQGQLKGVGCDCLGLIVGVWRELGGEVAEKIAPYTPDWAEAMGRETLAEGFRAHLIEIDPGEASAGDVVLFRWRAHLPAKHAAILTARNRMVHAQEGVAVAEVPMSAWWRRRMAYGFAFVDCGAAPAPSPSPQGGGERVAGVAFPPSLTLPRKGGGER